ncbi:putative DNA binding domain-containing protein [Macrococcoides bohemicum]|uniref:DNA binding domain-containing protein n=1 Tax=Macrococcoides bohemicum TaxID=1903056 RepID=A0AAJ4TWQ2_9STAP|nr:RNA-binding domain-containing protein [Macrococcus bohemicus]QYA42700.1 putative DNA binding domain-containing protein [Macrococcus bohemicus]QYA45075.1 putative DNA binding domain-containing protein [Macrococcus bohemicus]
MKTTLEILELLNRLEYVVADELESQDLDFKKWNTRSYSENVNTILDYAVCMANGGGGTVVFGIADKTIGKIHAIVGIDDEIDTVELQRKVYDNTDPHITPFFEIVKVDVDESKKQLLIMHVQSDSPPYTLTSGKATIRLGKECKPFTGSLRRNMVDSSSSVDFTSEIIYEDWRKLISPTALEKVREYMARDKVDISLQTYSDEDLLISIGGLKNGYLTKGALLIIGKTSEIERIIPTYKWSFRKMISDTDYTTREDSTSAIPIALYELERYINTDNPIVTIESGLIHPEYNTYPIIALREALLNSFGHRDYRLSGTIMLKQYQDKIILSNPGDFVGGITPQNILHHPPVARNNHLMELLDRLKLVNRSNLGVSRIYKSLLLEGKEPPIYRKVGLNIELTFLSSSLNEKFIDFVEELSSDGKTIDVDHLLIIQYLIRHEEIDTSIASELIQRSTTQAKEILSQMKTEYQIIEAVGRGKGRYYTLSKESYDSLKNDMSYERQLNLDKEAIKIRILTVLKERSLTNKEIRQITGYDQKQVQRLMKEMLEDGVILTGYGRGSKYSYKDE